MKRFATITAGQLTRPKLSADGRTIVVSVPISLRRQGGRKQVVTPVNVAPWKPSPARIDGTILKAIVRAHRWRGMLESKDSMTARDLARAENINEAYLGRVLRLTLLSPTIIEAILSGRQRDGLEVAELLKPFPVEWHQQQAHFSLG